MESSWQNLKRIWEVFDDDKVPDLMKPNDVKSNQEGSRENRPIPCLNKFINDSNGEESIFPPIEPCRPSGADFLKRYQLRETLGCGAFATTHLCIEKTTGVKYACKVIQKKISAEKIKDVRREISILRDLPIHQNIVKFVGACEDENKVYVLMELCEGGELLTRMIKTGFYTESDAAVILKDIIQAVKVCHEHGILHRDLKPENLLYITKEKTSSLKVIDFGHSTFFTPGQRFHDIVGTVAYMAPEVLKRNYGPEIDIWSAGIILYGLLCAKHPFLGKTDQETAIEIISKVIDFEGGCTPEISEEARDLITGMLNRDPSKRLTVQQILEHPWMTKMEAR